MSQRNRVSELAGGIGRSVSQLSGSSNNTPNPRSYDAMANEPFIVRRDDYDRESPPTDDMEKYWRQYETTPIVRKPINSFANRVIEPSYYLDYPESVDSDTIDKLYEWLENCAITEGEMDGDLYFLLKKAMVQREVRGTAIIEKVYAKEDRDTLMNLKMLNPETIEANTRPSQSILLHQDDHERDEWDPPLTPEGEAAAYLQDLSEAQVSWGRSESIRRVGAGPTEDSRYPNRIGFTKDDIIKLTRDADVGDIFGTSRIESVSDRIDGLKQKLQDNDEAIASKAYPLWLFKFGVGDNASPWSRNDIDNFMGHHEMDKFHAGMKQGVRGDVDIETISGEVADIAESLQFDLDWILSAMPMARQALGNFASGASGSASEVTGMAQERNIVRQLEYARKELSKELTPVVREKAEEFDVDEEIAEKIKFKVGDPQQSKGSEAPDVSTSRIEYHGVGNDADGRNDNTAPQNDDSNDGNDTNGNGGADGNGDDGSPKQQQVEKPSASDIGPFGDRRGIVRPNPSDVTESSELSSEAFEQSEDELQSLVEETALDVREEILDVVAQRYKDSPVDTAYNFATTANDYIDSATGRQLQRDIEDIVEAELRQVEYVNEYQIGFDKRVEQFTEDVVSSVYELLDDMVGDIHVQIKRAAHDGDEWATLRSRITNVWNDSDIGSRSFMIADMELHNARETMKLSAFEKDSEIVGVRIHNPDSMTDICEAAHNVEALFENGSIGSQFREQVDDSLYHEQFDPLPVSPPYHFGCDTVLEPIYEESDE